MLTKRVDTVIINGNARIYRFKNFKVMYIRLFKCIIAWILWVLVMAIPVLIFKRTFYVEASKWRIIFSVFFISFPFLLLCENLMHKYFRYLKQFQLLTLSLVFVLSEFIYNNLPWNLTKVDYAETWVSNGIFILFTVLVSWVINRFIFYRKQIVIVQKQI